MVATALEHILRTAYFTFIVGPPSSGCTLRGRITGAAAIHPDRPGELLAPLVFFETSDLIKDHIDRATEFGRVFQSHKNVQDQGGMQPDEAINRVFVMRVLEDYARGIRNFVVRGWPRTLAQGDEARSLVALDAAIRVVEFERSIDQCLLFLNHPERRGQNRSDDALLRDRYKTYETNTLPPIKALEPLLDANRSRDDKHYIVVKSSEEGPDIGNDMLQIINRGLFIGSQAKMHMLNNITNQYHPAGKLFLPKQFENDAQRAASHKPAVKPLLPVH